jgi:hypothetical protein
MKTFPRLWTLALLLVVSAVLYLQLCALILVPASQKSFAASKFVNDTAIAILNITNFVPRVVNVVVDDSTPSPANEIDLVSASFRTVWCNGTVIDNNGKDDIMAVNATLFFVANRSSSRDDMNEHYSNRSCTIVRSFMYNRSYSCSFRMQFFANNGTWLCNMSAWDMPMKGSSAYNSSVDSVRVNPIYALSVPPVINFGELALNQTSALDKIENVTNTGNMNIDLALHGYGGTNIMENNLSMICSLGNITVRNERFSLASGVAFDSMTNLSGQFALPNVVNNFNLAQRKSETLNSTRNTYWKIRVPQFGVKGMCNGTIVFSSRIDT